MPYKDPEKIKEYRKAYRESHRQYFRDAYNKWSSENRDKNILRQRKYLLNPENRVKAAARSAVYRAVRDGLLTRPNSCSQCFNKGKVEADHSDYQKRLEVTWLCKSCHTLKTIERKML